MNDYSQPDRPFVLSFTAEQNAYYGGPPFDCRIRDGSEGSSPKRVVVFNMKPHGLALVKRFVGAAMHQMGVPDDRLDDIDDVVGQQMDSGWCDTFGFDPEKIEFDGTCFVSISAEGVRAGQDSYTTNVIRFAEEIYQGTPPVWTGTPVFDLHPWDASGKEVADAGAGAGACSLYFAKSSLEPNFLPVLLRRRGAVRLS
jgi:hypothetical protein